MILLQILRLIHAFINDSEQLAKKIAETNDLEAIKSLLKILHGPRIGNLKFDKRISYYVIIILHKLIQHFELAKNTIAESRSLRIIVHMLAPPLNLLEIPLELENTIYLFLIDLIRDDINKKEIVGKLIFETVFTERLRLISDSSKQINEAFKLYSTHHGLKH